VLTSRREDRGLLGALDQDGVEYDRMGFAFDARLGPRALA
jgi:hypothetical protein